MGEASHCKKKSSFFMSAAPVWCTRPCGLYGPYTGKRSLSVHTRAQHPQAGRTALLEIGRMQPCRHAGSIARPRASPGTATAQRPGRPPPLSHHSRGYMHAPTHSASAIGLRGQARTAPQHSAHSDTLHARSPGAHPCQALKQHRQPRSTVPSTCCSSALFLFGRRACAMGDVDRENTRWRLTQGAQAALAPGPLGMPPSYTHRISIARAFARAAPAPFAGSQDILEDQPAMHYLQHASHLEGMSAAEQRQVVRRTAAYVYAQGLVWRVMADGTRRLVPPLDQRQPMVVRAHQDSGHWGSRRVVSLLAHTHWWRGMHYVCTTVYRGGAIGRVTHTHACRCLGC
jgi:hypothetical protein